MEDPRYPEYLCPKVGLKFIHPLARLRIDIIRALENERKIWHLSNLNPIRLIKTIGKQKALAEDIKFLRDAPNNRCVTTGERLLFNRHILNKIKTSRTRTAED